jgi:hypothetical protein
LTSRDEEEDLARVQDEERRVFVTYCSEDLRWAKWVCHQLDLLGYSVIAQHLDVAGGENFVTWMDNAIRRSRHVVAVVSQGYLSSGFTVAEWTAAYASVMRGRERGLIPIRVGPSELDGLLGPITHIDLIGVGEEEARRRLRDGMFGPRSDAPPFPGAPTQSEAATIHL